MNHYEVLNLLTPGPRGPWPSPAEVKAAYRAALLQHHPDKSGKSSPAGTGGNHIPNPSLGGQAADKSISKNVNIPIDAIRAAFAILSDPTARRDYDKRLALLQATNGSTATNGRDGSKSHRTGNETFDLDDFTEDEARGIWRRGCRCGDTRGFEVSERLLEDAVESGDSEVVVGCAGCSLWARISFAVVDGEEG